MHYVYGYIIVGLGVTMRLLRFYRQHDDPKESDDEDRVVAAIFAGIFWLPIGGLLILAAVCYGCVNKDS